MKWIRVVSIGVLSLGIASIANAGFMLCEHDNLGNCVVYGSVNPTGVTDVVHPEWVFTMKRLLNALQND